MAAAIPGLTVVGGEVDEVEACTLAVVDGQALAVGGIAVTCLLTPGHTKGHMTYYATHAASGAKHVFTGDVMFVGGVGKFFEGTAAEMHPSLYGQIGSLPDDTVLWPGHEYTVANLAFASRVAPGNAAVAAKHAWALEQRAAGAYTVPSSVGEEKRHNVFLRCGCLLPGGLAGDSFFDEEVSAFATAACGLDPAASIVERLAALRDATTPGTCGGGARQGARSRGRRFLVAGTQLFKQWGFLGFGVPVLGARSLAWPLDQARRWAGLGAIAPARNQVKS
jgi:hypothetical protein